MIGVFVAVEVAVARAVLVGVVDGFPARTGFQLVIAPHSDYDIERVGEGAPWTLEVRLRNLYPGVRYVFRVLAIHRGAITAGAEQSFTTLHGSPLSPTPYRGTAAHPRTAPDLQHSQVSHHTVSHSPPLSPVPALSTDHRETT